MKHLIAILFVFKLGAVNAYAQEDPGIQWVDRQIDKAWEIMANAPDSALILAQLALEKSEAIQYEKGKADGANALGVIYLDQQTFTAADHYFNIALSIRSKLNDLNGQASVLHNMSGMLADQGNYLEAVRKAHQAIRIWESLGEDLQIGKAYNTLSNIYSSNGDDDLARAYTQKSLELLLEGDDQYAIADAQYNLAEQYRQINELEQAEQLFNAALVIYRDTLADSIGQGDACNALGNIALERGSLDQAEQLFYESINHYLSVGGHIGLFDPYVNLGLLEETRKHYFEAIQYYQKAREVLGPEAPLEYKHYLALQFVSVYENLGNFQQALEYQKLGGLLHDSLFNQTKQNQLAQLQLRFETEKLANDHMLQTIKTQKRTAQRNLFMTISTGLLFIIGFGIFAFRQLKRTNILLMQKREWQHQREIGSLMKEQEYLLVKGRLVGQAEERRRIALEVNDGLASKIAAVNWQLEAIKEQTKEALDPIEKIQSAIKSIFKDIDQVVQHLKMENPNGGGLENALEKLKMIIEKESHLKTEISFSGNDYTLKPELEVAVYRILRELSANAIKHANATSISINLIHSDDYLSIIVEDDGQGFDLDRTKFLGMGLKRIELLVQNMEGQFHIDSGKGAGTTIMVDLPV